MAKEKTDSSKQGWFARWRERRARKKQRAIEITKRMYEERFRDEDGSGRVLAAADANYLGLEKGVCWRTPRWLAARAAFPRRSGRQSSGCRPSVEWS